jgi:hypothetical protein
MIIRFRPYTTSPKAEAKLSREKRESDPRGWELGGWGGPTTFLPDKSRSVLLEIPDNFSYSETAKYCKETAENLGWPITEGRWSQIRVLVPGGLSA